MSIHVKEIGNKPESPQETPQLKEHAGGSLKAKCLVVVAILAVGVAAYVKFWPAPEEKPLPAPVTAEERQFVRDAHRLGTRLLAISKRGEDLALNKDQQQVKLRPVYSQIEEFIFQRLANYSGRVSSIVVMFQDPGIQCTIYVKPGDEKELDEIKKAADGCVGRIIENLPFVKYLMIKNEPTPKS